MTKCWKHVCVREILKIQISGYFNVSNMVEVNPR